MNNNPLKYNNNLLTIHHFVIFIHFFKPHIQLDAVNLVTSSNSDPEQQGVLTIDAESIKEGKTKQLFFHFSNTETQKMWDDVCKILKCF